jgi:4-hydroxybutyryl-CoA dehydratase/vinylacetyl-CoA-Delta-isomerase
LAFAFMEEPIEALSRLIENLTMGSAAVGYLTESMRSAGSPEVQRTMISRRVVMTSERRTSEKLCGILQEPNDTDQNARRK